MDKKNSRRSTVWTRDKISHLIHLYKQHECLWNHHVEEYRSKDHRSKAIDSICNSLRITKYDFGKKIHNLRNQFNSEMKKLERRMEEAGDSLEDEETLKTHRCRWEHFEPLMFLRKVIEPRPGYHSTYPAVKKIRLKFDELDMKNEMTINEDKSINSTGGDDLQEFQLEETTEIEQDNDEIQEFETIEEEVSSNEREENYDYKISNSSTNRNIVYRNNSTAKKDVNANHSRKSFYTCIPKNNITQSNTQIQDVIHIEENQPAVNSVIEMPNSSNREHNTMTTMLPVRDQWDVFGELIANEFRLLNSEKSRKKLKRKIMHDLLIIGEEDDNNCK